MVLLQEILPSLLKCCFQAETDLTANIKCHDVLKLIDEEQVYLVCNGRIVDREALIDPNKLYHVCHRLPGGKGGFGSMLRTIGAQIEKTTNREAMRDLSGRRMRDINNEKKLADWVAGSADREEQREERRKERLERRRAEAEGRMHKFKDEQYMEQKDQVITNLDDALTQGLKRTATGPSSAPRSKKGKAPATVTSWAGLNMDDLSSSDDDSSRSEGDNVTASTSVKPEVGSVIQGSTSTNSSTLNSGSTSSEVSTEKAASSDHIPSVTTTSVPGQTETHEEGTSSSQPSNSPADNGTQKSLQVSNSPETSGGSTSGAESQATTTTDKNTTEPIDLSSHNSVEELEGCGLERLKHDLIRRGLKCGGSLQQRALRLYSVKGLADADIDPSLFAKKKK